jgi:hypothetical protein
MDLKAAKARLEQLLEERRQREEKASADEASVSLLQAVRDEEAIAKAEAEHGPIGKRIGALKTDAGVIIVKRPHHLRWRELTSKPIDKISEADATALLKSCLVHPTGPELETILETYPALNGELAGLVLKLARGRAEEVQGK